MLHENDRLPQPNYLNLTLHYSGVLVFVAIITMLIFWISYSVTLEQQKDGELIKISGQQRTLTLEVEALGTALFHEISPNQIIDYQDRLTLVLEQLERTHMMLAYGDLGNGVTLPTSDAVQTLFFGTEVNLDLRLRQYIEHGFVLAVFDGANQAMANDHLQAIQKMRSELDEALDLVVLGYQKETDHKIAKLKAIQQAGLFAMLAVLLSSAIIIFRPMVQKIRSTFQVLQGLHETLAIHNVELEMAKDKFEKQAVELVHMSEDLTSARDEAERAQRAMGLFMSSMSHELRTPLNAILGFSQLMEYDKKTPLSESQKEGVGIIKQSGEHLLDLINELLDLSKIESGTLQIDHEMVEPRGIIDECLGLVQMQAKTADIEIKDETQGRALPAVMGDGLRVKQVLLNFLSNAIKYNSENGQIVIRYATEREMVKFSISDTGNGLSPEQLKNLFQPYARLGAEDTAIEGTGLGLTITKRLVELMNGAVGVESVQGKGSTFWVALPVATGSV